VDATTAVAVYAALVGTGAAAIQLAQLRGTRTRLRIKANAGVAPIESESRDSYGNPESTSGEVLFIEIVNRSPHPVKITHLGVMTARRRKRKGVFFARPYPLYLKVPIVAPERDRVTLWQPRASLNGWETERMRVVISTAAGDDFESKSFRMDGLMRLETVP
jgi:hypothetical protein